MKKKAIVSTVAGIALAGVMCVGFAACGGGASAKSVKGEEIDAATWDAAFENEEIYKNFKLDASSTMITEMTAGTEKIKATIDGTATYYYADQKTHAVNNMKTTVSGKIPEGTPGTPVAGTVKTEYYLDESVTPYVCIDKVDGKWANVTLTEENSYKYASAMNTIEYGILNLLPSEAFADYVYSAEHKGYVEKDAKETDPLVVVKFKDGKLKAVYAEGSEELNGVKTTTTYSFVITYGGQSVTLPTVA